MQRLTMFGMVLLAALAVGGVEAVSVSASGHEFISSKTGKTKGKSTSAAVFKTSAGTLECSEVTGAGEIAEGKSTTHKETYTYSGCSAFGSSVTMSPAHFEFNAGGTAKLEKAVTITPTGSECEIVIPVQTVEGITYENASGKIKASANIFKIHSKGTGGSCGAENTEGSYTGSVTGEVEGGSLEWK